MMIPIKIHCGCGQHYSFEVEPVEGRMPSAVACPVCGTDGTAAANAALAQSAPPQPAVRMRVAAPVEPAPPPARPHSPGSLGTTPQGRQIDLAQVEAEARAKILWGDPRDEVVKFLMLQGLNHTDASAVVEPMYQERIATLRRGGITKIITGSIAICVPVVTVLFMLHAGYFQPQILGATVMLGLYGSYLLLKGTFMVISPKTESGDASQ